MADHPMTPDEYAELVFRANLDGGSSETDVVFACDVKPQDHLHFTRLGAVGSKLGGRIGMQTHGGVIVLFSAGEARKVAASIMNLADELDGTAPLVFHPPRVIADENLDTPGGDE